HVIELLDAVFPREVSRGLLVGSVLFALRRRNVVEHDRESVGIVESLRADLLHHADGAPCRRVAHDEIGIGVDDLTRRNAIDTGFRSENLFRDCLTHWTSSVRGSVILPVSAEAASVSGDA